MLRYSEISYNALWPLIESGAALVTANRRLARKIAAEYADRMKAAGVSAWETPLIMPFSAWINDLYEGMLLNVDKMEEPENDGAGSLSGTLTGPWPEPLSENEELWIWVSVIEQSEYGRGLLQTAAAAKTAQQALSVCRQWKLDKNDLARVPPPDTQAFIDWAARFENRCHAENRVDAAGLPDLVATGIRMDLAPLTDSIIFAGFDCFPPQTEALIEAIAARGKSVSLLSRTGRTGQVTGFSLPDTEAEITQAARWARALLETEPGMRIGIIVPDLEAVRRQLVRIFDDILHPGLVLANHETKSPHESRLYNISLGPPLSTYPMIRAALTVLKSAQPVVAIENVSQLLLSPFVGGAEKELANRGVIDAALRRQAELETEWNQIIELAAAKRCPVFCERLRRFKSVLAHLPAEQPPSRWAESFLSLLESLQWPGERSLSSSEYQCRDAWQEAMARLAAMDRVAEPMPFFRAFDILNRIVSGTAFQPETGNLPVQVLGVLESAGEIFDAAWIMGLDNEHWPPEPRPNPLIPVWLQRKHNVLHASAERELAYARQITDRLFGCAPTVVLSYPRREGDAERFPSPLVRGYLEAEESHPRPSEPSFWGNFPDAPALECFYDSRGPGIADGAFIRGGTALLKAQASCPFSAFARFRLGAEALEQPAPGLDAAARGILIHRCMELLWQRLKTHAVLMTIPLSEQNAAVEAAVAKAVEEMAARKPRTFTDRFEAIEKARLFALIKEWLAFEKKRAPFSVQAREKGFDVPISGFFLRAVADRIDGLTDGRIVLIDYKTNKPQLTDWFADRMPEPQLPLYAVSLKSPLAGVMFAQIRKGESKFIGVATDAAIAPGIKVIDGESGEKEDSISFSALLSEWRCRLEKLAAEIKAGHAAVAPESLSKSCRYCDLAPICRISERDLYMHEPEYDQTV